jgi:hypothetical protein
MGDVLVNVARGVGYEEILDDLVRLVLGIQESKTRGGCDCETDVFVMRTEYLGPCTCNFQSKQKEFDLANPHKDDCFYVVWREWEKEYRKHSHYHDDSMRLKVMRINDERRLCQHFKVKFNGGKDLDKVCTCGVMDRWKKLNIEHDSECPIILPNFHFKPIYDGIPELKIWWRKKYLREAVSNRAFTLKEFETLVSLCKTSYRRSTKT